MPNSVSFIDYISIVASVVSLILAFFAIWLSRQFKLEADTVNQKTIDLLIEIRTDAKSITKGVMHEYHANGDFMRNTISNNILAGKGKVEDFDSIKELE